METVPLTFKIKTATGLVTIGCREVTVYTCPLCKEYTAQSKYYIEATLKNHLTELHCLDVQ